MIIWPIIVINMINKLFIDFIVLPNLIACVWNLLKWPSASQPCKFSHWDRIAGLCVYPYTHSERCQTGLSSVLWFLLHDTELGDKNIRLLTDDYWGPAVHAGNVPLKYFLAQTMNCNTQEGSCLFLASQYSVGSKTIKMSTSGCWPLQRI